MERNRLGNELLPGLLERGDGYTAAVLVGVQPTLINSMDEGEGASTYIKGGYIASETPIA